MICKPCRLGADIQTELQVERDADPEGLDRDIDGVQRALHDKCKGCDCQHRRVEPGKNVQVNL